MEYLILGKITDPRVGAPTLARKACKQSLQWWADGFWIYMKADMAAGWLLLMFFKENKTSWCNFASWS